MKNLVRTTGTDSPEQRAQIQEVTPDFDSITQFITDYINAPFDYEDDFRTGFALNEKIKDWIHGEVSTESAVLSKKTQLLEFFQSLHKTRMAHIRDTVERIQVELGVDPNLELPFTDYFGVYGKYPVEVSLKRTEPTRMNRLIRRQTIPGDLWEDLRQILHERGVDRALSLNQSIVYILENDQLGNVFMDKFKPRLNRLYNSGLRPLLENEGDFES